MSACELPFPCRALVGFALLASVLGVPVASASSGLPAPDLSTPSLPKTASPQPVAPSVPQPQVEAPTAPHVPAVEAPAGVPGPSPNSSGPVSGPSDGLAKKASGSGVDLPAAAAMEGGTNRSTGTSMREAHQTTASARGGEGNVGRPGVSPPDPAAGSLQPAQVAPALAAYVWPAIALDPAVLFRALQGRWEAATSLLLAGVPDLLSGLAAVGGPDRAKGAPERPASVNPTQGDSRSIQPPSGGEIPLLLFIAFCAALALLIFTLRREFRAMHRRPL
jgi:hypothetical protein